MLGKSKKDKNKQIENYDRVYALHEQAEFLCYINEAYKEPYEGSHCVKLEGIVAKGTGSCTDFFELYDCNGRYKGRITLVELYLGTNRVDAIHGGDKPVAIYPVEQDITYRAGDILCKLTKEETHHASHKQ